ncbi:MAG TPA: hypothetical protein H9727_00045 [Candidatus Borkfalkia avistercoris]|uniref:Beta-galactosidase n=1 Tax=Candidatus Borkfalkia avistercoris TaxID=2838504 RepID=A0A9D2A745_9FIRM|nr:hypothetical protein [Candidatus Borkfalkia avistercoris]
MNYLRLCEAYPAPQFAREKFLLLDGEWEISLNGGAWRSICVPFCPESAESGVGYTDFIFDCKYRKRFTMPDYLRGERLVLRFGAVDRRAEVYVNGAFVGSHAGGYTPFGAEISAAVKEGENLLEVRVHDDVRENFPSGKQSARRESFGCFYTRVTGIWQSVWLEATPAQYVRFLRIVPNAAACSVEIDAGVAGKGEAEIEIFYGENSVAKFKGEIESRKKITLSLSEKHLWELGCGRLYAVRARFGGDEAYTYFGLRDVRYEGKKFLLNGKSVFQRLALDQGYYPNGIYTAGDTEFEGDIRRALALGFNGVRLHQKVFDPKYLFLADKLGFMVWGEFPGWGVHYGDLSALGAFIDEWREAVERDFNCPSVVTWCPLNETWRDLDDPTIVRDVRFVDAVYEFTKILDPSRPCVDVSGGLHGHKTDVADFHCYGDLADVKRRMETAERGEPDFYCMYQPGEGISYNGEPLNLSEFGGVSFGGSKAEGGDCIDAQQAWGYDAVQDEKAFIDRYTDMVKYLLGRKELSGFCYTQLYDVEQEQNGLFTYARRAKFSEESMRRIREANMSPAAIEEE